MTDEGHRIFDGFLTVTVSTKAQSVIKRGWLGHKLRVISVGLSSRGGHRVFDGFLTKKQIWGAESVVSVREDGKD